jgi:ferredoxin-type protein NapH
LVIAGIFIYDLLVASRGWCGHLCPVGAFYGLLGKTALVRVPPPNRKACDDCMDCFIVCPEPQVIRPALKQVGQTQPPDSGFRLHHLRPLHRCVRQTGFQNDP